MNARTFPTKPHRQATRFRIGRHLIAGLLLAPTLAMAASLPRVHSAIFGADADQTLRVSVLNTGADSPGFTPCVHLLDGDGRLIGEWSPRHPPEPGRAASIYLDLSGLLERGRPHPTELWIEIDLSGHQPVRGDPALWDGLLPSLELFDTGSGTTRRSLPLTRTSASGVGR